MIRLLTIFLQIGIFVSSILLIFNTLILMTPKFKAEIEYANLNKSQIAYFTRGKGDPLILIEGYGMTMQDWDPILLTELSKKNRIIVFDLRQAGLSKGDITNFTINNAIEDIVGLMDNLKVQKADILGWSMGSLIAQEMAISYPNRVNKVILASSLTADNNTIYMNDESSKEIEKSVMGTWEQFTEFMFTQNINGKRSRDQYLKRRANAVRFGELPKAPSVDEIVKISQQKAVSDLSIGENRTNKLKAIKNPVLIITGDEDLLIPPVNSKILEQAIPNSQITFFQNSGHAFLFSDSQKVALRINQFLN